MTEVFDRVLLGNRHDASDVALFNQQNIGLVVNVTDNINNHFERCNHVKRRIPKHQQTEDMISLSQSSVGEVVFDEEGRNVTPTKQSQESLENPLFFDDESNSSMCETPFRDGETLYSTTTSVSDYLTIPSQVSDSSDLSSVPSDPMLTFDDENSIMSSVTDNGDLMMDTTSMSSIRDEVSNGSETPQKSQDEPVFATPKSKSKRTPKKSSQKKERKQVAKVFELVKLNHSVMYHKISIEDSHEVSIVDYFDEAISKIENFMVNNPEMKVMIHCREGKSRSVSTLVAYGMKHLKLSLHDCYNHVTKKLRGNDRINDGFKRQLMGYELDLLKARSVEDPEIVIENSLNFFQKRGRYTKSYALNEDHRDDEEDFDYDEEDQFDDDEDDEDDEDGDYEEKKKKPKKRTGGRKKKGPQFSKDWKDIAFEESKPQKGKQLSLFDMFAKKKPVPATTTEPAQPSKQATLDSLFSPKKPKKSSTKKQSSAKKLDFDNLPQEATIPEVVKDIQPTTVAATTSDNMDTTDDAKVISLDSTESLTEKPEVHKDGKKKKKEKDQNKSTKKVFKRAPRFPTPEEPVPIEEPKKETKKRKKTEESKSSESKKKKTKKEKSKKETENTTTAETNDTAKPSSEQVPIETIDTAKSSSEQAPTPVEEKPKQIEKPKTGGLFKYFKPKSTTIQ